MRFLTSFIVALLTAIFCLGFASADDIQQSQEQLKQINKELLSLQNTLAKKNKEATRERRALQNIETEMGRVQTAIVKKLEQVSELKISLASLQTEKLKIQQRLADKKEDIEGALRLAYKQNNQPLIKILLTGKRPEELSRHLYYFSALTENQQAQVQAWLDDQNQLAENVAAEQSVLEDIQRQQTILAEQKTSLDLQIVERSRAIDAIAKEANDASVGIKRKELEQAKMTELIADLKEKLEEMKLDIPEVEAIGKNAGKLPWPVEGRLTNGYGRSIDGNSLKWQGWLIAAPSGSPVRAVHGGRIIFADFFKSNGLLLILDHGNGIWSLYGRNRALLRDVGSWVEAGDVIAEVGQSGGYSNSGLYFEVRKNGEPVNPAAWLNKR